MSFSLSHGKTLDPGNIGIGRDDLPALSTDVEGGPEGTRMDLRRWFESQRGGLPLELELGSGKGTFLLQQARVNPDVNYIGVEWARAFWRYAADRCRRAGLEQVRVVRADAAAFVKWYAADGIFRQIHIYFPDPWPKKRHHKRRLIQDPFLRELHRVLVEEGVVRLVTDHTDYFRWMREQIEHVNDLFAVEPFQSPISAAEGEVVGTNFERKYRREGRAFHAMALRKR